MAILTDRTALASAADDDLIHIVKVSDPTDNPAGTSFKISRANYLAGIQSQVTDESFTATAGQTVFELNSNPTKVSVYYGASRAHPGIHYNTSISGGGNLVITFTFELPVNTPVIVDKF